MGEEQKPDETKMLTADELRARLNMDNLRREVMLVPELGGRIRVKGLRFGDYMRATKAATTLIKNVKTGQRDRVVDDQEQQKHMILLGIEEPKFGPTDVGLIDLLEFGPATTILNKIMELSGLSRPKVKIQMECPECKHTWLTDDETETSDVMPDFSTPRVTG